jgi:hypothetical protein
LSGDRVWGSEAERQHIARRLHGVAGHIRRLKKGRHAGKEALERAERHHIIVPDDHTYVRPHVRGGDKPAEETQAETYVHARGLATIMALWPKVKGEAQPGG